MTEIVIPVSPGLDDEELLRVLNTPAKRDDVWRLARAIVQGNIGLTATVHDVSVASIYRVPRFPSQVTVFLCISWSLYKGCEDRNLSESDDEFEEAGTYSSDGQLIFQSIPPARQGSGC